MNKIKIEKISNSVIDGSNTVNESYSGHPQGDDESEDFL